MGYGSLTTEHGRIKMIKERRKVVKVEDKKAEQWIKALTFAAGIIIPLIGFIGVSFLGNQQLIIENQKEMNVQLSRLNAFFQTHESRISRNEKDIKEVFTAIRENHNGLR